MEFTKAEQFSVKVLTGGDWPVFKIAGIIVACAALFALGSGILSGDWMKIWGFVWDAWVALMCFVLHFAANVISKYKQQVNGSGGKQP